MNRFSPLLATACAALLTTSAGAGNQAFKLLPSDGAAEDAFGCSVDVGDGFVVVGSRADDDNGAASGSAYLFDAASGAQVAKLLPDDGAAGDEFGFSVAISGGIVVVGSRWDDDNGENSGSVYLFDAGTGAQLAKLLPDDGAAGDEFGFAVAIDASIVVVGAKRDDDNGMDSGAAYVFDTTTGVQLEKLLPDDGTTNDNFGGAVAIDGGIVAVGAHAKWNGPLFLAGAAYLFEAATGDQVHKLLPNDAAVNDFFGAAIDIDGGIVVVGAWAKSIVFDHSGAAYLFDASSGNQIGPRLVPADSADRDNFGRAVAIANGVVAVAAPGDSDNGVFEAGSAYLFDVPGGDEVFELYAADRAPLDNLGSGIALAGGLLVVGADRDDDNGANSGAAYLFQIGGTIVPGDVDGDGVVGFSDILMVIGAWGPCNGACPEDLDGSGDVGFSDVLTVIAHWAT